MLDAALAVGEYLEFAFGAIDKLVIALVCIIKADLSVLLAMGHKERHLYPVHDAVQGHVGRLGEEIVHVGRAEHPHHMRPIVGHGVFALAIQPLLLHFRPIVIGAPHCAGGEARFERDRARRIMTAQRNAGHADARGIDIGLCFQPIDRLARPYLAMRGCGQAVQAQRLSRTGLIDAQCRYAAPRERVGQLRPEEQFLAAVQPIAINDDRLGTVTGRAVVDCGIAAALIGDFDALHRVLTQRHGLAKRRLRLVEGGRAAGMTMALHPLCRQ
jgi:hypothetical protein